ncbi:MAG: EI24 domain-containing protein [Bacteroidetes bacterium]|nr:EI24 domain-containing protein [Bacteroidota bacterium]
MKDFFYGLFYPFKSIGFFFRHPKVILLSLIPTALNIIVYSLIFYFSYKNLTNYLPMADGQSENITLELIEKIYNYILYVLTFLLVFLVSYLFYVIIGGIISAPFNETISQYVEETVTGIKCPDVPFLKDTWLSIKGEIFKLLFYFSIIIPLYFVNFIPVAGTIISTVIGLLFSFFYNSLDFFDYPMQRKNFRLRDKIKAANTGGLFTYGFGVTAFLMMFLPFINSLFKPLLVVAGTKLYLEKINTVSAK